jgi:hypothetical protein
MVTTRYRRTPLPADAQTPVGWLAACFMALVFSPFVGFAFHGRVDDAGLVHGLWFALLPLTGLAAMALRRWRVWRRLPPGLIAEWTGGRLIPAAGAPPVLSPARFADKTHVIELLPSGLVVSRGALLAVSGAREGLSRRWIAEQTGELFVAWEEIAEWCVDTDSEGPDYYALPLRAGGAIRVRRFVPDASCEGDLLDAVRAIGRLSIRLRCDVDGGA